MSAAPRLWPDDAPGKRTSLLCLLVALSLVLGGGGSPNPLAEIVLQCLFAAIALALLWIGRDAPCKIAWQVWAIAALVLAIPLVQLVPLPPGWWQGLPGREAQLAALRLVGEGDRWRALSIAPHRTLASLLAMVPPVILALLVAGERREGRRRVVLTIALMAVASAVLGALQMASTGDGFRLYPDAHSGWLTGFHANRNAAADLLLIGAVAAAAAFALRQREEKLTATMLLVAAYAVLLIALLLTGSRTGIALVPVAALGIALILAGSASNWRLLPSLALVAGLLVVVSALAMADQRLAFVASRFGMFDETRVALWRDSLSALGQSWPWGTGVGTFVESFLPQETLASVDASMPNRAHSDWLELAMEAGVYGYLALFAAMGAAAMMMRVTLRDPGLRPAAVFALTTFILVALHALIDYPVRNMAGASLVGVALGMLAYPKAPDTDGT